MRKNQKASCPRYEIFFELSVKKKCLKQPVNGIANYISLKLASSVVRHIGYRKSIQCVKHLQSLYI